MKPKTSRRAKRFAAEIAEVRKQPEKPECNHPLRNMKFLSLAVDGRSLYFCPDCRRVVMIGEKG
jgi:hypothetical protein